jgi:hypothetical protein
MKEWLDKLFGRQERNVREPQFSGHQYPAGTEELESVVIRAIDEAHVAPATRAHGLIAPYGDYELAGSTMGEAWARLAETDDIERAVLLGSSGRVPFRGVAVARFDGMRTPLGVVDVDLEAIGDVLESDDVRPIEAAFEPAAALELQIPFVQVALGDVEIVPMLVGDADPEDVVEVIERVAGPETVVVVSANLSEGHSRDDATEIDGETVGAIEALDVDGVGRRRTTGRLPIQALIQWARRHERQIRCRAKSTSADAGGPSRQVVGYGAFEVVGDER